MSAIGQASSNVISDCGSRRRGARTRFIHEDFDGEAKVVKLPIFRVSQIVLVYSSGFGSLFIRQMCSNS